MKKTIDDRIIRISAGIGRTIAEAGSTLMETKKRKDQYRDLEGECNINVYQGEPIPDKIEENLLKEVKGDLRRLSKYKGQRVYRDMKAIADSKKVDSVTGALTPYGYLIEMEELRRSRKKHERYVIMFDCDNMKELNDEFGYDAVSQYIHEIGRSLVKNVRTKDNGRSPDKVALPLVYRKHGSAGDEFIVNVACRKEDVTAIAERLIKAAYQAQIELAKKQ